MSSVDTGLCSPWHTIFIPSVPGAVNFAALGTLTLILITTIILMAAWSLGSGPHMNRKVWSDWSCCRAVLPSASLLQLQCPWNSRLSGSWNPNPNQNCNHYPNGSLLLGLWSSRAGWPGWKRVEGAMLVQCHAPLGRPFPSPLNTFMASDIIFLYR